METKQASHVCIRTTWILLCINQSNNRKQVGGRRWKTSNNGAADGFHSTHVFPQRSLRFDFPRNCREQLASYTFYVNRNYHRLTDVWRMRQIWTLDGRRKEVTCGKLDWNVLLTIGFFCYRRRAIRQPSPIGGSPRLRIRDVEAHF